ncbi:MAG: C4-type zinc ribbon domain-containing protein [Desulfobacteraceae bacterium]|nr:C4-type zinc ribbon domain-containing protein [Desulfobacteraceae bacterium]
MKEQIKVLVKLQHLDTETARIKSTLNDVSKKLENLDSSLIEIEQTITSQESVLNELKKEYRDYESDAKMNLAKNKKSQEKLRSVKTNKEYQSLLKEIEDVKSKNSLIEDKMIECLDRIDETEDIIAKKKNEYLQFSDRIKSEKQSIEHEAGIDKKKLDELDMDRKNVSGLIDSQLFKKYLVIKEQNQGGLAVVPVKDAVCHGCNVNLPPQLYNELFRYKSLKFCPNCQRIIYLKE